MPFDESPYNGSENDDNAPMDYVLFESVTAGERRRQSEPIHRKAEHAEAPAAPEPGAARGYEAARRDPFAEGNRQIPAHVAYPRPRDNAFAQTPTYAPRVPQGLRAAQPPREGRSAEAVSAPSVSPQAAATPGDAAPERANRRSGRRATAAQPEPAQAEEARNIRREAGPSATGEPRPSAQNPAQTPPQAPAQPDRIFDYHGSRYQAPPTQEIPDWLKAAQQNKVPYYANRRPPRVDHAPQQPQEPRGAVQAQRPAPASRAEAYAEAGYPPELVASQRGLEEAVTYESGYGHMRHGAQFAAPPQQQPGYDRRAAAGYSGAAPSSYPPSREDYARRQAQGAQTGPPQAQMPAGYAAFAPGERPAPPAHSPQNPYGNAVTEPEAPYAVTVEKPERRARRADPDEPDGDGEDRRPRIPFLGIAVFLAALLVIGLVILRINFEDQTQSVLEARAQTVQSQIDKHPYSYRELIEAQAAANNLHPAFVAAACASISSRKPNAESSVGARGLMQLMPDTAEWVHGKIDADTAYSFDLMYDPDTNVKYACWYLAYLSDQFYDDPVLVSAAFHAGQTTVRNWLNNSLYSSDHRSINLSAMEDGPTKNYAVRVVNAFAIYKRLYYEGGTDEAQVAVSASAAR